MYVPSLEAKDLALALELKATSLLPEAQRAVGLAVKRLVRAAWMLDGYGDLGNRPGVEESYAMLATAVADLKRLYDIP